MLRVSSFGKFSSPIRDRYCERLKKLIPFEWVEIPIRQMPSQRENRLLPEEEKFLKEFSSFTLLDVKGKDMTSEQLQKWAFTADRHLVIGPAIGFHSQFYERAQGMIKLSSLTLTHELAQTVLAESLYRAVCMEWNHPFAK